MIKNYKPKTKVFLPITPYTLDLSQNIARSIIRNDKNVCLVLINPHGLSYDKKLWNIVFSTKCSRKTSSNKIRNYIGRVYQIICFRYIYFKLRKFLNKSIDFYYVDLAHILSNSIFFNFRKIENSYVIEDGFLNYNPKVILKEKMLSNKMFRVILKIIFMGVKEFEGHITGIQFESVQKQIVTYPEFSIYPQKSIEIIREKIFYTPQKNAVLVLGVDCLIGKMSKQQYEFYLSQVIKDIFKQYDDQFVLYYKEHHHGEHNIMNLYLKNILKEKLVFISDTRPIELLIKDIKPSHLITFGSTASMTLMKLLQNPIKSDIYYFNKNIDMIKLFKKLDISVKIIDSSEAK